MTSNRETALNYLVQRYPQWPITVVNEERPITSRVWGSWRWVLSLEGEVMFANGVEPAICVEEYRYAQGNREVYNVH